MRELIASLINGASEVQRGRAACNPKRGGDQSSRKSRRLEDDQSGQCSTDGLAVKKGKKKAGASPPLSTRPRKHTHVMLRSPYKVSREKRCAVVGIGEIEKKRALQKFLSGAREAKPSRSNQSRIVFQGAS